MHTTALRTSTKDHTTTGAVSQDASAVGSKMATYLIRMTLVTQELESTGQYLCRFNIGEERTTGVHLQRAQGEQQDQLDLFSSRELELPQFPNR